MVTTGVPEIMARLARLETRVNRMNRIGKIIAPVDYENLLFTVQPSEPNASPLTGVRCLYTRMHPHLTEFALPEVLSLIHI